MRIAFLAGHLSRRASGVRQMIEGLSGALAAQGADIRVFGIRDEAWANDHHTWMGADAAVFDRYGPATLGYMPKLGPALAEFDPDLVHLHGIWMYSSAVAADWAKEGRPLIVSPHGMLAPAALTYSPLRKRLVRALYQDRCFNRAAGYVATAESEAADIRNHLGDVPVSIVPTGVPLPKLDHIPFAAREKRILALGRLHPVKGYDRLLEAWAKVERKYPEWQLEIAGPDPDGYGAHLNRLIVKLGLTRAKVGPPRFGNERDALIADSRLFALPSLTENFALTVPESLICGTPVLASTATPWSQLVDQGCGWWVDGEPEALALALEQAITLSDDELAQKGERGRAWAAETFSWEKSATVLSEVYRKALAEAT